MMSFGIALAGGGARGAAHVGVLLALEEAGLCPRSIAGTSAGSIVAGLYATGTTPQMLKEIVIEMSGTGTYYLDLDIKGIVKAIPQFIVNHKIDLTGLIKGNRLERFLYEQTNGKSMKDTTIRTIIPTVDINSSCTVAYTNSLENVMPIERVRWEKNILISEAMRASCAVPAVFQPKFIDSMCLVDGGVTDVLPVDLLLAAGENNVLAVDVAAGYKMPKNKNLIEISSHSLSIMSTRLKECHSHGEKLLLNPSLPEQSGLLTLEQMVACMNAGYEAANVHMSTIKAIFR
jgi:NTE family protein